MKGPKMPAQQAATPLVALPDLNDANIRKAKADALSALLKNRGRSSTIFKHTGGSGQLSDQVGSTAPRIKALVGRG